MRYVLLAVVVLTSGCGKVRPQQQAAAQQPQKAQQQGPVWLDARTQHGEAGDWQVGIKAVRQGQQDQLVGYFNTVERFDGCLQIKIVVGNAHPSLRKVYTAYNSRGTKGATLKDELGNSYGRVVQGRGCKFYFMDKPDTKPPEEGTDVDPQEMVSDLLVFDRPVPQAQWLYLTLPAKNVGGKEDFRFAIPTDMIVHQK